MKEQRSMDRIAAKFSAVGPFLDERLRRVWAANAAQSLGRGGVTLVARATRIARSTLGRGLRELQAAGVEPPVVAADGPRHLP